MKKYLDILKLSKLFTGINGNEIEAVLFYLSAVKRNYRKDEYIFRAGEHISSVALLLEGNVHIQREDYWGNLSILNKVFKGEIFGEAYALSGSCAILNNAVAVENSTILFLDFNRIFAVNPPDLKFYPVLIQNFFSLLAEKNRILAQKLGHMSQRTTREKLLSYLSEQSIKSGSPSFDIPFNRQQMAEYLNLDRSALSKELSNMQSEGLLNYKKNHFTLYVNKN